MNLVCLLLIYDRRNLDHSVTTIWLNHVSPRCWSRDLCSGSPQLWSGFSWLPKKSLFSWGKMMINEENQGKIAMILLFHWEHDDKPLGFGGSYFQSQK